MARLENPPENPCFGCGPANGRGLHLEFERSPADDGVDEVRARYVPRPDEIGWPGLLHGGLHYFLLHEASYWAALTLGGRVHRFGGRAVFEQTRLPRVGRECMVAARVVAGPGPALRIRATTTNDRGAPCGTLDADWVPARRAEVVAAGLALPDYLLAEMDP